MKRLCSLVIMLVVTMSLLSPIACAEFSFSSEMLIPEDVPIVVNSEEVSAEYADQDAFLADMAAGINKRVSEAHKDTTTMSIEENMEYYHTLVSYELEYIEKYSSQIFADEKFNMLAHFYIEACQMQRYATENYRNENLYNGLWNGGSNCRSGIITTMYDRYDLPIAAVQAEIYQLVPTYSISFDDDYSDYSEINESVLEVGDLNIIDSSIESDEYVRNFKFTVMNESGDSIEALGLYCTVTDLNGNVLGTQNCRLGTTIVSGKTAVLDSWIQNNEYELPFLIIPDYFEYTLSNGDYGTVDVEPNNAIETTITQNEPTPESTFTPKPTATPMPEPTATPKPTATPTPEPTATPTPLPQVTSIPYTHLEKGSKGKAVKELQTRLKELGFYSISVDGDYGNGTVKAMEKFQTFNKIEVTGIATPEVQAFLYSDDAAGILNPGNRNTFIAKGKELLAFMTLASENGYSIDNPTRLEEIVFANASGKNGNIPICYFVEGQRVYSVSIIEKKTGDVKKDKYMDCIVAMARSLNYKLTEEEALEAAELAIKNPDIGVMAISNDIQFRYDKSEGMLTISF